MNDDDAQHTSSVLAKAFSAGAAPAQSFATGPSAGWAGLRPITGPARDSRLRPVGPPRFDTRLRVVVEHAPSTGRAWSAARRRGGPVLDTPESVSLDALTELARRLADIRDIADLVASGVLDDIPGYEGLRSLDDLLTVTGFGGATERGFDALGGARRGVGDAESIGFGVDRWDLVGLGGDIAGPPLTGDKLVSQRAWFRERIRDDPETSARDMAADDAARARRDRERTEREATLGEWLERAEAAAADAEENIPGVHEVVEGIRSGQDAAQDAINVLLKGLGAFGPENPFMPLQPGPDDVPSWIAALGRALLSRIKSPGAHWAPAKSLGGAPRVNPGREPTASLSPSRFWMPVADEPFNRWARRRPGTVLRRRRMATDPGWLGPPGMRGR